MVKATHKLNLVIWNPPNVSPRPICFIRPDPTSPSVYLEGHKNLSELPPAASGHHAGHSGETNGAASHLETNSARCEGTPMLQIPRRVWRCGSREHHRRFGGCSHLEARPHPFGACGTSHADHTRTKPNAIKRFWLKPNVFRSITSALRRQRSQVRILSGRQTLQDAGHD